MNTQELKTILHQQIDQADSNFLQMLYDLAAVSTQQQNTKLEAIKKIIHAPTDAWKLVSGEQEQRSIKKKKKSAKPVRRLYNVEDLEQNLEMW